MYGSLYMHGALYLVAARREQGLSVRIHILLVKAFVVWVALVVIIQLGLRLGRGQTVVMVLRSGVGIDGVGGGQVFGNVGFVNRNGIGIAHRRSVLGLRLQCISQELGCLGFTSRVDIKGQYIIRTSARKVTPVVFVNIHGVSNLAVVSFVFSFRLVRSVRQDLHRMRGRSISCG